MGARRDVSTRLTACVSGRCETMRGELYNGQNKRYMVEWSI